MQEPNGVYISMRDIYDELVRLKDSIRELAARVDSSKGTVEDHESRIRDLERWKYAIPVTLLATIAMVVAEIIRATGKN